MKREDAYESMHFQDWSMHMHRCKLVWIRACKYKWFMILFYFLRVQVIEAIVLFLQSTSDLWYCFISSEYKWFMILFYFLRVQVIYDIVLFLQSTSDLWCCFILFLQSTGDSLDDEDDDKLREVDTKKNTSYNEVIDADNPQTPVEVSRTILKNVPV